MRRLGLSVCIVSVGIAAFVAARDDDRGSSHDETASVATLAPVATPIAPAAAPSGTYADARAVVPSVPSNRPGDALSAALAGDDDIAKIDAVEAAVAARQTSTLPALLVTDLAREPEAAPTIIHAVADLANAADEATKRAAVKVLARWLGEESSRHDADAEGNVPNIVEALATIGGSDAAAALIGALEGGKLDLSVETLVVESLGRARDTRALAPVEQFVARVSASAPQSGIHEELRSEAIAAGTSAISAIQGG